jgi:hypothetical protein
MAVPQAGAASVTAPSVVPSSTAPQVAGWAPEQLSFAGWAAAVNEAVKARQRSGARIVTM